MDCKLRNKCDFKKIDKGLDESEKKLIRESGQDFIGYFYETFNVMPNEEDTANKIKKIDEIYNKILTLVLNGKINFDFDNYKENIFGEYFYNFEELRAGILEGHFKTHKKLLNQIYDDFIKIDSYI